MMGLLESLIDAAIDFAEVNQEWPTAAYVPPAMKMELAWSAGWQIESLNESVYVMTPGDSVMNVYAHDDVSFGRDVMLTHPNAGKRLYNLNVISDAARAEEPEWRPRDSYYYVRKTLEHDAFDLVRIDGRSGGPTDWRYGLQLPLTPDALEGSYEESPANWFCWFYDEASSARDAVTLYMRRGGKVPIACGEYSVFTCEPRYAGCEVSDARVTRKEPDVIVVDAKADGDIKRGRLGFSDKMFKALVAEEEIRVQGKFGIGDAFRSLHELGNGWRVERDEAYRAIRLINDDLGLSALVEDSKWESVSAAERKPRAEVIREKLAARKPKLACQGDYLEDWE